MSDGAAQKRGEVGESSACERELWCVLQVEHDGDCSTEFAFTTCHDCSEAPCCCPRTVDCMDLPETW